MQPDQFMACYKAALDADTAFDAAVKAAGYKSRWDWHSHRGGPDYLMAAYQAKISADAALHELFAASWNA